MTPVEIIIIIIGIALFVLSFVLPEKKGSTEGIDEKAIEEKVKSITDEEMKTLKGRVEDTVEETVNYAVEKAERAMERISNEKIMAVNEYSDTVLNQIHKNHEEVVFLYDMLNDKQKSIKQTVQEVNQAESTIRNTAKENAVIAEEEPVAASTAGIPQASPETPETPAEPSFKPFIIETIAPKKNASRKSADAKNNETGKASSKTQKTLEVIPEKSSTSKATKTSGAKASAVKSETARGEKKNKNEQILAMNAEGKSNMAIAKELGLGVGEVKLVIDLYKGGMK